MASGTAYGATYIDNRSFINWWTANETATTIDLVADVGVEFIDG